MAVSLRFIPGSTIRWRERRFVVVDYAGMDAIVAREVGKRRVQSIPVNEAVTDLIPGDRDTWTSDLASAPEEAWQTAVRRDRLSPFANNLRLYTSGRWVRTRCTLHLTKRKKS